jgi:hypothetical protein
MIGIIAHWETLEETEYLKHIWTETVKPLYATHLYFVDKEGNAPKEVDLELTYKTFPTLLDAINEHPEATLIYLEAERNIPNWIDYTYLKDFVHPAEDVIYVFGPDSGGLPLEKLEKDSKIVTIKTFHDFAIWQIVAIGITLYDRMVKWQ